MTQLLLSRFHYLILTCSLIHQKLQEEKKKKKKVAGSVLILSLPLSSLLMIYSRKDNDCLALSLSLSLFRLIGCGRSVREPRPSRYYTSTKRERGGSRQMDVIRNAFHIGRKLLRKTSGDDGGYDDLFNSTSPLPSASNSSRRLIAIKTFSFFLGASDRRGSALLLFFKQTK